MRAVLPAALLASLLAAASPAAAQVTAGFHRLEVPGGRAALRVLGVADTRERSAVMIDLIRRLHFSTTAQTALEAALHQLPAPSGQAITVPMPLASTTWSTTIFERPVPASRLFAEILNDPAARLLFHGLAGMDAVTRTWIGSQPDLLRQLYRDPEAIRSFALFAPAVRVNRGRIVVPGGRGAERRWTSLLDTSAEQPARFIGQLFGHRKGRTAGLYALTAFVDPPRQAFLLGASDTRFGRLVSSFADCYPEHATDYPMAVRSHDAALLLLEIELSDAGAPAGPHSQRFWQRVFESAELTRPTFAPSATAGKPQEGEVTGGEDVDAAWMVDRLCATESRHRAASFATLLAGHRAFANLSREQWPDAVIALRVRRLYPAVFMAMEHAGIRNPVTFSVVGRHALKLERLNDMDGAPIVLGQFQGALALILNAAVAQTVSIVEADRLLASLSAVPLNDGRYDGLVAGWLEREWLPAIRQALNGLGPASSVEQAVASALAGPRPAQPVPVHWEGVDYVVDFAAATRQRLLEVRARQGGATLDQVLDLMKGPREATPRVRDALLAQALVSWAYAPHVGTADGGGLIGGDSSMRHDLGLRSVNRTRYEQRWEVAVKTGDRGAVAGSLLGLQAPLAQWSLRRLSSDTIPPPPTIGDNDLASLLLTVALSDPRRLTDAGMSHIASAIGDGSRRLAEAGMDPARLLDAAEAAAMSPWKREALPWIIEEERDRLQAQFGLGDRARIGGLRATDLSPWGTASLVTGCLCLRMPRARIPELVLGRPADGIVGARSADLMLRVAILLSELKLPAALASPVLAFAMRDFLDAVRPQHAADFEAFDRQAVALDRAAVEDYLGAIAAVGALRPVGQQ